jgi:hypothetical protein
METLAFCGAGTDLDPRGNLIELGEKASTLVSWQLREPRTFLEPPSLAAVQHIPI